MKKLSLLLSLMISFLVGATQMNAQTRQTTSRLALPDSLLTAAEQVQKRTVMRIVKNNLYVKNDSVMISPLAKDSICEASGEETYQVLVNNVEDINAFLHQHDDALRKEILNKLKEALITPFPL